MKKILGILFVICLSLFPMLNVYAAEETININDYATMNLKEALESEEMTLENKDYKETDDQITIYLFRGQGCGYCKAFLTFLNSISKEYGKYFKLRAFDAWYDNNNSALLDKISEFVGNPAQGVPYIIIGEEVFPGYAADYDEDIKKAITTLYDSEDKYDVFEAYNAYVTEELNKEAKQSNKIIVWNFIFTMIATMVIIAYIHISNTKLLMSLKNEHKVVDEIKEEFVEDEELEEDEVEEEIDEDEELEEDEIEEEIDEDEELEEDEIEEVVEEKPNKKHKKNK